MGKGSKWSGSKFSNKHGRGGGGARDDSGDEMEATDGGFFGGIGTANTVSTRQKNRLDAEDADCIAKYGAAPMRYQHASPEDAAASREAAKNRIAAAVAARAVAQKQAMPEPTKKVDKKAGKRKAGYKGPKGAPEPAENLKPTKRSRGPGGPKRTRR